MVAATVAFAAMHAAIRHLSSALSPFQIAFFRCFFGLLIFLPVVMRTGVSFLHTDHLNLHLIRAVLNVASMWAFFWALSITPIARVTALSFTSPLFMAVISVVLLGEVMRMRRWAATILGFVGAVIIIRPGFAEIDFGSILVLGSAAAWAVCMAIIKILGRADSSTTITGYANLLLSVITLVPAILVWTNPEPMAWFWLVFIGVVGTLGQLAVAEALKQADATAVMPFDFLKLIWAASLGFILFGEIPDNFTWLGAAVIFASGMYLVYRERQIGRQKRMTKK
jgi:drug/metabolite transporter (DMT)-like permease